ncbi:hypothetical protein KAJ89_01570 [Candidatus Parcubacteria bacterium]|nr:hypothetical protein [Candidatus Parcubacteria bacterium]
MTAKNLESFFNEAIAEIDGVKPEDVTVEYIRKQREKLIYPTTRFDAPFGLVSFTGEEWEKIEQLTDELLALF